MQIYLYQNEQQVGPYSEEQLREMVAFKSITQTDLAWYEGLPQWQTLNTILAFPAPPISPTTPNPPVIQTNVKQGAIIGGWVCFVLGFGCMFLSLFLFFIYGPLFLVAAVLGVVAMSQRRVVGGIFLLLSTLILPTVVGLILFATRATATLEKLAITSPKTEKATGASSNSNTNSSDGIFDRAFDKAAQGMKVSREKEKETTERKELEELRQSTARYEQKIKSLEAFRIIDAKLYRSEDSIGMKKPVIELIVQNNTGIPVKRAYFRGVLTSPGRSVPWIDDTFNYEISGGLETGEKVTWKLAPNMFGEWARVEAPADAVFTVTLQRLDGADDKELFSQADFSEAKNKRFAELEEKYK